MMQYSNILSDEALLAWAKDVTEKRITDIREIQAIKATSGTGGSVASGTGGIIDGGSRTTGSAIIDGGTRT